VRQNGAARSVEGWYRAAMIHFERRRLTAHPEVDTIGIYLDSERPVEPAIGKLFMHGRSQAVRLPAAFRFPGTRVRVSRVEGGVLLQPVYDDLDEWFAAMDAAGPPEEFMPEGRPPQGEFEVREGWP
jgi:antitoxin VapB